MAARPTPLSILQADFPAAPAGFLTALNTFVRQVIAAFTNALTFSDNHACTFRTLDVPGGIAASAYTIPHGLKSRCTGLMVWNVVASTTGYGVTVGAVNAQWKDNGDGTITIAGLGVLAAGPDYVVTFLCFAEPL